VLDLNKPGPPDEPLPPRLEARIHGSPEEQMRARLEYALPAYLTMRDEPLGGE
jgi:hypothetical protein